MEAVIEKSGRKDWPKDVTVGNVTVKVYRVAHATAKTGFAFVVAYRESGARSLLKFADPSTALDEARLKATQLNAGRIEGASMTSGDRDELSAARRLCGEIPLLSALSEWARVRELTGGNAIAAAEAWQAKNSSRYHRHKGH